MTEESINQMVIGEAVQMEDTHTDSSTAIDNKKNKEESAVFEFFTKDEIKESAQCKSCHKRHVYRTSTETTSLWKDYRACKVRILRERKKGQLHISSTTCASNDIDIYKFDQERSREDVARYIIMCEVPFTIVDHWAFRTMISNLRPEFKQYKRTTITKDCIKLYWKEKELLKNSIVSAHGRISLTTDTWTSCQTKGYMSLTAHYIDDEWKLNKKIINFVELDERHTGTALSNALSKCLLDWEVEDKLFSLTMDNCSANKEVANNLKTQYKSSLPLDGDFFHIRCSAHILNLVVKEGLKDLDDSIVRIRDAVKFITSSPQRLKKFDDCKKKLKLSQDRKQMIDCPTRWNSTYKMLDRALEFKEVFVKFHFIECFKHPPLDEDWLVAKEVCKFLKVFDDSTNVFSGSKLPTSNLYFYQVCKIDLHLRSEWHNPTVKRIQEGMKENFKQYWDDYCMILSIAAVFDPRWKFDFVEFMLNKVHGSRAARQVDAVREKLDSLFEYYSMIVVPNKSVEENEVGESSSVAHLDGEDLLQSFYNFKKTSKRSLPSKNELELYLDEEVFPDAKCFDVLEYWSVNVVKYPILASMARDILAIPVSTVASESAFSTDSRVVSDRHSCLKGSTIEALICTRDWMRGNVPNDQNIDLRGFVDEGCDEEDES